MKPVIPKAAATLVLLRNGQQGLEVFMVERSHSMSFAPGAMVFPGGKVDRDDWEKGGNKVDAHRLAAIREVFEETGALLVLQNGQDLNGDQQLGFSDQRQPMVRGTLSFSQFCAQNGLLPSMDALFLMARWVTPATLPQRFDTMFFAAMMPENQIAIHDGDEAVQSEWVVPAVMLTRHQKGDVKLLRPTIETLKALTPFHSAEQAIDAFSKGQDGVLGEI